MNGLALHATGIQHRYGKQQALIDIAFSLPAGTRCGLIGPDGAGKSSLLGLIAGSKPAARPTGGARRLDRRPPPPQQPVPAHRLHAAGLGGNLYPELSISETSASSPLFGLSKAECDQRMHNLLLATDLNASPSARPASCLAA
jgi:ribosome-dependent ATPase